jgi:hypothetical protein
MIWEAFLTDLMITDGSIRSAVADLFEIDFQSILIVEDICDLSDLNVPRNQVLIERRNIGGDFPLVLTFYIKVKLLSDYKSDELYGIMFLCHKLCCQALISDLDINPYSWYLVSVDRSIRRVYVDADKLDDKGQFSIDKYAECIKEPY